MPLNGLESIVYTSASVFWQDEPPPTPEHVTLFDALPILFKHEDRKTQAIKDTLAKIHQLELQPSQDLRYQFWCGRYCMELDQLEPALAFFSNARLIAEDHNDIISVLEMTLCMANELHDGRSCSAALDVYRELLDIWEHQLDHANRRIDTEIQIRAYICREEWSIGEFDAAHGNLAHALTKALGVPRAQQTPELRKETANGLWDLALALRSDSDEDNGDLSTLNHAKRRMQTARDIYKEIGVPHNHLARLDVQFSDLFYDVTELHLQHNSVEAARAMRARGDDMAREAREMLVGTNDAAASLLERIVSLRPHIMWPKSARATKKTERLSDEEIETRLIDIERESATLKDNFLVAKAATLRGDWLMMLGEWEKARTSLELAIEGFGVNGKGMATRAERLMRHLPPKHDPENGYGGADPEHGSHN